MKKILNSLGITLVCLMAVPSITVAAEMDHSQMGKSSMDHSKMGHGMSGPRTPQPKAVKKGRLDRLSVMPPSGRPREAGYDGRYAMEATSVRTRFSEKCAQATRGLIMLDNASWKRCGGKPKGGSMGLDRKGASGQMNHSQMKH